MYIKHWHFVFVDCETQLWKPWFIAKVNSDHLIPASFILSFCCQITSTLRIPLDMGLANNKQKTSMVVIKPSVNCHQVVCLTYVGCSHFWKDGLKCIIMKTGCWYNYEKVVLLLCGAFEDDGIGILIYVIIFILYFCSICELGKFGIFFLVIQLTYVTSVFW